MAALADDKGWTFDAFDPGTLREFTLFVCVSKVACGGRLCASISKLM